MAASKTAVAAEPVRGSGLPWRAFVAIGGKFCSVSVGRWGRGPLGRVSEGAGLRWEDCGVVVG